MVSRGRPGHPNILGVVTASVTHRVQLSLSALFLGASAVPMAVPAGRPLPTGITSDLAYPPPWPRVRGV
jgi:hypothetical protein